MIFVTGDTHANFSRFKLPLFPEQKNMTTNDYVIICGDFGGIWSHDTPSSKEMEKLDFLASLPFTILFVDGNHENFDRLKNFPRMKWNGGMVHQIRHNIYHLMRGYVFKLEGKKFFTFGGAKSHDVKDGILDPKHYGSLSALTIDYNFRKYFLNQQLRINHYSWWKDELPTKVEMDRGIKNLQKEDFKVDYVISHCLPKSVISSMFDEDNKLTDYFDSLILKYNLKFKKWYAGHYHKDCTLLNKYEIQYFEIKKLL